MIKLVCVERTASVRIKDMVKKNALSNAKKEMMIMPNYMKFSSSFFGSWRIKMKWDCFDFQVQGPPPNFKDILII